MPVSGVCMTEKDADPWKPWEVDGKLPRDAFSDLRYQVRARTLVCMHAH